MTTPTHDTNSELNNLMLALSTLRKKESDLKALTRDEAATIGDLRRMEADFKYALGRFDEQYKAFLQSEGFPESFHILELANHFWQKARKTLVIPS